MESREILGELDGHPQSRGRTPTVFVFNPFAEGFIREGRAFSPRRTQAALAHDLENLPQFLCRQDDVVLVNERPELEFLSRLQQAGFIPPEFVLLDHGRINPESSLLQRRIGGLRPWAWGPDSIALLRPLFSKVIGEHGSESARVGPGVPRLYSKAWSAAFLRKVLEDVAENACATERAGVPSLLCRAEDVGVAVRSLEEALAAIDGIRARGHPRIVAKKALGLAGQNALRLWEPQLLPTQRRWLAKALEQGDELVIEPWLERVEDFSIQLEMGEELALCGYTGLITDLRGQYLANWAAPDYCRRIPQRLLEALGPAREISLAIHGFYERTFRLLETELGTVGYQGPVGIDAFVYRGPDGGCRLKPIVEINPRYTMGRVTLELMRHVFTGHCGLFRLIAETAARVAGHHKLETHARTLMKRFPLSLQGEPIPRIYEARFA